MQTVRIRYELPPVMSSGSEHTASQRLAQLSKTFSPNDGSAMAAPQTMRAIKCVEPGKVEIQNVSVPEVTDDYILVKVSYVALNPTDW